jgi:hypothetical protein
VSNSQKSKNHKMSKQIFSKIAKIGEEVRSAQSIRVEFALIDDIKSETIEASKGVIRAIELVNEARVPAKKSLSQSLALILKIQRTIVSAKELGADEAVKTLEQSEKNVLENIKTIENVIAVIDQI